MAPSTPRPVVLYLGDEVQYDKGLYKQVAERFTVIRPSVQERQRDAFLQALRDRKWEDTAGSFRPHWNTDGEMGRWDRELIALLPESFRVYMAAGAGFDWADTDIMAERAPPPPGIIYCNGATASSSAVSDMALYHIISVFRNMEWSNNVARSGNTLLWEEAHREAPATARNPKGHTVGIVGLGHIGSLIASKARAALGMTIAYYDVNPKPLGGAGAVRYENLDEMLGAVDCVVLAAPGTAGRVLDRERIAKIKRVGRVVNIARGNPIDEEALADALESGALTAVGLDVYEKEPNVCKRLAENRVTTLTCHNGGGALETWMGFEDLSVRNLLAVLSGQEALTPVNKHLIKKA